MMNIFTVDVEEFHHRLAYSEACEKQQLEFNGTASRGVRKIIKILNHFSYTATFFVIGEIIEKDPSLANLILENGHEIGNHTFRHTELNQYHTPRSFEEDLVKFDNLVNKIVNKKPLGFRAPKWSVTSKMNWLFDILRRNGYRYDASIYPAKGYGYGLPNSEIYPYRIDFQDFLKSNSDNDFFEFPTIIFPFLNMRIPIKLRHFGTNITMRAIEKYNSVNQPATLLLHSWEFVKPDPKLFYLANPLKIFVRNYNISCEAQLIKLFKRYEFVSIEDYLAEHQAQLP